MCKYTFQRPASSPNFSVISSAEEDDDGGVSISCVFALIALSLNPIILESELRRRR